MRKRSRFVFFVFLLCEQLSVAQIIPDQERNMRITPFWGTSNLFKARIQSAYEVDNHKRDQLSYHGFPGLIGIRTCYFITDNLSIGGELNYTSATIQWKENERLDVDDSTNNISTFSFNLKASRFVLLAELNYHFSNSKRHDWYLGLGLGGNHTFIKLSTDAPYRRDYEVIPPCFFPISARINLGFNYYITKLIALNAELGIGGPLASLGITVKI